MLKKYILRDIFIVIFGAFCLANIAQSCCCGCGGGGGEGGGAGSSGGSSAGGFATCAEVKLNNLNARSGLYDLKDEQGSVYRTYCDMKIAGGGWTLVASIHENFLGGKCTVGDKWSSEQGNRPDHTDGDGNWENTNTFGSVESATSDDYKNPGYFNMEASDVMIWIVPNGTPVQSYEKKAVMKFHTQNKFLTNYGGNLYSLFKDHFPLRHGVYDKATDNGPVTPIIWDRGTNDLLVGNLPPNFRPQSTPGFIQFRVINNEKSAFALCPGIKMKLGYGDTEHWCVGGTSNHLETPNHCGDFGARAFSGYGTGEGWSANKLMSESAILIFYRYYAY